MGIKPLPSRVPANTLNVFWNVPLFKYLLLFIKLMLFAECMYATGNAQPQLQILQGTKLLSS